MFGAYRDAVRSLKARQEVKTEHDSLLQWANTTTNKRRLDLANSKDNAKALLITIVGSLVGMIPYAWTTYLWFRVYHQSLLNTMSSVLAQVLVGLFLVMGSTRRALGKERPWMWWLGAIWLQAFAIGCLVGFFVYFRHLAYYWKYEEMRTYTNVAAAQDASAFGDGSMFLFTTDTRLDVMRSVGYRSRWSGTTLCVAPLVDVTMNQGDSIQYFAVGEDCCSARAGFLCDDAGDSTTRTALRVLEPEEVARSFMSWAVRDSAYGKYMDAVRLQEATYATKSTDQPTLVVWTKDPITLKNSYYSTAKSIAIQVAVAYYVMLSVGIYQLAWQLIPKPNPEGVIRN